MSGLKDLPREPVPLPLVLRETLRHYLEFRQLVTSPTQTSNDHGHISSAVTCDHGVIDYGYYTYDECDVRNAKIELSLSYWDLHDCLMQVSARKREAVFYNVILDWKQKDVAAKMGISTVSVGQYVQAAMEQVVVLLALEHTITEING